jgi:hypothetical protein
MTRTPVRLPDDAITITWRAAYDVMLADATSHRTMTPLHPRWNTFLASCRRRVRSCPGRGATQPFPITTTLLTALRCDVARLLVALNAQGAYCDCTILYNATRYTPDNFPGAVEFALRVWSGEEMRPLPTSEVDAR